jgi:hypothetical protein
VTYIHQMKTTMFTKLNIFTFFGNVSAASEF